MDIYKITDLTNGKIYIGKTKRTIEERLKEHINKALREKEKSNMPICRAIYSHGAENFIIESLYSSDNIYDITEKEDLFIKQYSSMDKKIGYNGLPGGGGIIEFSEETKKRLSENGKKRVKEKNPFYGKHHSDEQKNKWKITRKGVKGKPCSEENKKFLSNFFKNKWKEKEFREKVLEGIKNNPPTYISGEGNKRNLEVRCIELNKTFPSLKLAEDELNRMFPDKRFSRTNISNVCRGKKHTHNNFTFEFIDKSVLNKKNHFNKNEYSYFKQVYIVELDKTFRSKKECSDFLLEYTGEKYHEKYIKNDKKYKQFTFKVL